MEKILKEELGTKTLKPTGQGGGGCINEGEAYHTDQGLVFVKRNAKSEALRMFEGEYESLKAMEATHTIRVPHPIKAIKNPKGGAVLVMEYLDMNGGSHHSSELGKQLAKLHKHNWDALKRAEKEASRVTRPQSTGEETEEPEPISEFGFHIATCCGYLPLDNAWHEDWVSFYSRQRLKAQLDLAEKKYGDREARELWPQVERIIPNLFSDLTIKPCLLHGDLWSGNVSSTAEGPVIFDPASFYGHNEFEFGIATMFGGMSGSAVRAYREVIPEEQGFKLRLKLYQLFHYLNHWNHFGGGYRGSSLSLMRELAKAKP